MLDVEPPSYNHLSSAELPEYRPVRASTEQVLLSQPLVNEHISAEYQYKTKRMLLKLGRRIHGTSVPCYGKNAVIEGRVLVKSFKHVEEVSVTVTGKVNTGLLERGFPILHDTRVVLFEHKVLWSSKSEEEPPTAPKEYPISFPLPTYARGRTSILPPSATMLFPGMEADVRYTIKIDMCRKGLRRHECTMTPFFYLPKSIPTSLRSVNSAFEEVEAKVTENLDVQWLTSDVKSVSELISSPPFIQFSLPLPLSYPSHMHIPFMISILTAVEIDPDIFLSNLSVTFIKRVTISVNGYRTVNDRTLGGGTIWKMEKVGDGIWNICGSVIGGREGGEMTWTLPGSVDVKYGVQLAIRPAQGGLKMSYQHLEIVQVTTHEELTLDDARELPALGLIGLRQHPTHP